MPKREDKLLIKDILQSAEYIFAYTKGLQLEEFISDRKTLDAVVRNFEIIGEACKLVSDELRINNPLIEWRLMADFRNILIHQYFGIDYELVWDAIQTSLPYNIEFIKRLLPNEF